MIDQSKRLFQEIREEYLRIDALDASGDESVWDEHPMKISIPLEYEPGTKSMTSFFNVVACRHSSGYFGSKSIVCDMAERKTTSATVLFNPDCELVGIVDSKNMTDMRCAFMALLAVDQFYNTEGDFSCGPAGLTFGFIGTGAINRMTAHVIKKVIGEDTPMTAVGSPKNPHKDIDLFPEGTIPGGLVDVFECDVVFVCTTETSAEGQVQFDPDLFSRPDLLITHDTGCLLGDSFRTEYNSFSDDPGSLHDHFEDCFPWDSADSVPTFYGLCDLPKADSACVYLYGMAFCDVIMAMAYFGEIYETG